VIDPRAESHVRLKEAVRRNRTFSREGLLERLFERLFRGLVYTQIWEDPEIDLEALALGPTRRASPPSISAGRTWRLTG
jgi:S-adenosylmethionine-diacylglycerol 3-amino-3-carboxypropyl transferase